MHGTFTFTFTLTFPMTVGGGDVPDTDCTQSYIAHAIYIYHSNICSARGLHKFGSENGSK